ncbi:CheW protein [Thermincola ferriacetica]|uniref:CheW protein n=1 Tax=Thermincola ferriacetica TaxID=281456 RepID=A0A0L6W3M9_9FIRM|nr:chemotaxis protein CheW [Thermincola ferriacetica]KNZ69699.1 CheW protein [Thermincola ferriacetica]
MSQISEEEKQYVVFRLGSEVFGIDINKVKEIIVYQEPTHMPGSSEFIEGIINLRGHVIPIVSLRKKFNFPEAGDMGKTRIIVVEAGNSTVGIVVDGVSEVVMISGSVIEKPSSLLTSTVDENYITGVAKMESGLVIILDLEKVIGRDMAEAV